MRLVLWLRLYTKDIEVLTPKSEPKLRHKVDFDMLEKKAMETGEQGEIPSGASSMKVQNAAPGLAGRGQLGNPIFAGGLTNGPTEAALFDKLVGRKVRTRWPNNNFNEVVITSDNPTDVDDFSWLAYFISNLVLKFCNLSGCACSYS